MLTHVTPRRQAGFSLIELMMAVAIMALVITYTLVAFTFQHQTYLVVDQVSETQQNVRGIAWLMERDIRSAGYLVPSSGAACGIDNTNAPDILFLSDADAIRNADELGPALASSILSASVSVITSGSPDIIVIDDLVIDGEATYDTNSDGTAESDFQIGGGVILVDDANPDLGVLCGTITAITTGSPPTISVNLTAASWSGAVTQTPELHAIPAHVYRLTSTDPPALQRDGIIIAKDVEDLQVAWFMDGDGDNQVDANEYDGDDTTNTYDPQGQDVSELREMRINLVLRTRDDDARNPTAAGRGQATENRATAVAGTDGRHRRMLTATIRLRNLPAS